MKRLTSASDRIIEQLIEWVIATAPRSKEAQKKALKARISKIMKQTRKTLACAPTTTAADTGKYITDICTVKLVKGFCDISHRYGFLINCEIWFAAVVKWPWFMQSHFWQGRAGSFCFNNWLEVHTLYRRVGRTVCVATGGGQGQVGPRCSATIDGERSLYDTCTHTARRHVGDNVVDQNVCCLIACWQLYPCPKPLRV